MVFNSLHFLLLIVLCTSSSSLHEFYVSITYLNAKEPNRWEVRHRIFRDDLESALRAETGNPKWILSNQHDSLIFKYILEHTGCWHEQDTFQLSPDFVLIEGEGATATVTCQFKMNVPPDIEHITYHNALLVDHLEAQINMVHYVSDSGRRSKNLNQRQRNFELKLP